MIDNAKIADYLDSLFPGNSDLIESIRTAALEMDMPIIRREGEVLLRTLLRLKCPKRILEIGTCVGYSAIIMADATADYQSEIITLEIGEADYKMALGFIDKTGYANRITCMNCDATDELKRLVADGEKFDFIFMDAAKAQYVNWLSDIEKLTDKGAILLSDNVLHDGDIAESRFAVERRDRTIHSRLREYLWELTHSSKWTTSVMNVADGMSLSIREEDK